MDIKRGDLLNRIQMYRGVNPKCHTGDRCGVIHSKNLNTDNPWLIFADTMADSFTYTSTCISTTLRGIIKIHHTELRRTAATPASGIENTLKLTLDRADQPVCFLGG
ncbi:hypothetical protein AAY84_13805 [Serratia marcescens]|nr:hypothetical protein AAY84_13805 [Serratia marcescens]